MKRLLLLLIFLSACGRQQYVTGKDGLNGKAGATGSQGAKGATGSVGDTGLPGPQGEAGVQGSAGNTGATGPQGEKGDTGSAGPAGVSGVDGTSPTVVQLCPGLGVPSYPNNFLEVGFCISNKLYGVYSANGQAALTELPPGTYTSTAPQSCTLTVLTNCEVIQL